MEKRVPITNKFCWQLQIEDKDLTTAPGSPSKGDRYIITGTGGNWSGGTINDVAVYNGATWDFYTPVEGWRIYIKDENIWYFYDGSNWRKEIDDFTIKHLNGQLKIDDRIELNIMLNAFDIAVENSIVEHAMIDGMKDVFEDESGIDTGASANEDYDSVNDLYKPTSSETLELDYMEYATDGAAQAAYVSSDASNLQSYSEDTIKQQGSYSLKGVALITGSLNDTLTKSGLSLDLSDINILKLWAYASRTGTNLQVQLKNNEPSWDLLNEPCANLDAWLDASVGDATVTVDPAGQFKLDSGANSAANDDYAIIQTEIGNTPNTFTAELKLYCDNLGLRADWDFHLYQIYQPDERFRVFFASDGIFIGDTSSGEAEVGTNLVKCNGSAEWQTWRFLVTYTGVTGEGTCDVYLNDSTHNWEKVGTSIPCGHIPGGTDGYVYHSVYGWGTNNIITHLDYTKIASGLYIPPSITHTKDINITSADVFQEITWDISGISNANKSNITQIIFKILNADSETTYYIDNFYAPGLINNMTLISNSETAEAEPDTARIVIFEEDVDSITENTDIKAYVSRDGGSTYALVTLTDKGDYQSGKRILTGVVDLTQSGIGSGTNIEYKIETLNNKSLKLHGVGMHWS